MLFFKQICKIHSVTLALNVIRKLVPLSYGCHGGSINIISPKGTFFFKQGEKSLTSWNHKEQFELDVKREVR